MKKFLIIISISLFSAASFSQQLNLSIDEINSSDFKVGDTVFVNVNIEKFHIPISSFQVYLKFDQSVLKYIETRDVMELFEKSWRDNITESFYIALFIDLNKMEYIIENDDVLFQLAFIYQGGETDILWGRENKTKDGLKLNGQTKFLQINNDPIELNLKDGCVCNHK